MEAKSINLNEIGNSLLEHARGADFTARGVVAELFPFIIGAAKRMSTRAISKFLEEKHGVRISFVTIGKALRNPEKHWNAYFDQIERSAWTVAKNYNKALKEFMSESEKYQEMLESKPVYVVDTSRLPDEHDAVRFAMNEHEEAQRVLDEKWFCFDDDILEEGRIYLIQRFAVKPSEQGEDKSN